MIISCPACSTRYVVPDAAIGVDGRTVRCAKCRHSWYQTGPELVLTEKPSEAEVDAAATPVPAAPEPSAPPVAEQDAAADDINNATEASDTQEHITAQPPLNSETDQPNSDQEEKPPEPSIRDRIAARAASTQVDYSDYFDGTSSFAHEAPFRPRLHVTRMWTIAAVLFATISMGLMGAVAWYGLPDWMPFSRPLFAASQPGLILSFPPTKQDRRVLPDGTAYFGANGTITNVSGGPREVPMIMVVLRDASERIVYTQAFASPKAQLNPGETVKINQALAGIPANAKFAEFGWKPG